MRMLTAEQIGSLLIAACAAAIALIWISPWLLLPVAGAIVARASCRLPGPLRDPVKRLGWLTTYSTLPVGIAGLALAVGKGVLPPDDFLWLMLRTYDLHQWTDHQIWLKPVVLVPLLGAAGILSIATARPEIIARFGRLAGLAGQAALSLYVLSLFSFITPGPFVMKLNEADQLERNHLKTSLQLQRDAEKEYLANMAVMVLLENKAVEESSHLADITRDAEIIARRLGCARDAAPTATCGMVPSIRTAFERSLPKLDASAPPASDGRRASGGPTLGAASAEPEGLPALKQAVADADTATERLRKKGKAAMETIYAMIGTLADLLPFDPPVTAVVSEICVAVAARYGDTLEKRSDEVMHLGVAALDELGVRRLIADVPRAIAQAAATLHDAAVRGGPWVLVLGPDATQEELDSEERFIKEIETTMPRGSTVNMELAKRLRERGPRDGASIGMFSDPLDSLERFAHPEAPRGL